MLNDSDNDNQLDTSKMIDLLDKDKYLGILNFILSLIQKILIHNTTDKDTTDVFHQQVKLQNIKK